MDSVRYDLIYLLACAVNGVVPDSAKTADMDIKKLYKLSKYHTVRAAVGKALERAGIRDNDFGQAEFKAVRKNILLDTEWAAISKELEAAGIWHMPLKGSILKEMYPESGMREMADYDILFDKERLADVKKIMADRGYEQHGGESTHQVVFMKPPVLNFEMHTALFGAHHAENLYRYYREPMRFMKKDEGMEHSYHFNDEDFYIFMTAHEYKHFYGSGTGIRSLLDCYVYMKEKGGSLDSSYLSARLSELGIYDYEKQRRELAMKIFSSAEMPGLTAQEQEMLDNYFDFGTYGTIKHRAENKVEQFYASEKKVSKGKYILRRLFPDLKHMKQFYPAYFKCRLFIPFSYIRRMIHGLVSRRSRITAELKELKKHDKK